MSFKRNCVAKRLQDLRPPRLEDEAHFLVSCPQHNELRKSLLPQNILHNNSLSTEDKLAQILSESEHIKSVAKFIYLAFEDRKLSLEVLGSIDALIDSVDKYQLRL